MSSRPKVVVVGAGAFGGWTALSLRQEGADVTLLDAWGPGHPRASSGGQTRIIRATYGPRRIYTRMAARALRLWKDHDHNWGHGCLRSTGAIWMSGADTRFGLDSHAALEAEGIPVETMAAADAAGRWPQINFYGLDSVLNEPDAGYRHDRQACAAVVDHFVALGGRYQIADVLLPEDPRIEMLNDGTQLGRLPDGPVAGLGDEAETARRLKQRREVVLDWAMASKRRHGCIP
jgi:glycine/D-amino acid oxidase-like deaminating enzyme